MIQRRGNSVVNVPEWCRRPLSILSQAAPDAFATGDLLLLPFFSSKFGPTLWPIEIDVVVGTTERAEALSRTLRSVAPQWRWNVRAPLRPEALAWADGGVPEGILHEICSAPLTCLCGAVRLEWGEPVWYFGFESVEEDLRSGRLRPHGEDLDRAREEAEYLLARFPALEAEFLEYQPRTVEETLEKIHEAIRENEYGGRRSQLAFSREELPAVERVRRWHEQAQPRIEPLPLDASDQWPDDDSIWWSEDDQFRGWLIDQTLVRRPRSKRNAWLHEALAVQRGVQKPTHQGWETYQHAIMAAIALRTDLIPFEDHRAMRVAAILHDIGKVYNIWTPGCHALIGAKRWMDHRPPWLTDVEAELVTFLIKVHDMLGLMDRGIMNSEYRGAVSPAEIRAEIQALGRGLEEGLTLATTIYQADIASVPALRWLLPLTPLLQDVVLAGAEWESEVRSG